MLFKKKKDKAGEETTAVEFAAPPETETKAPEIAFTASDAAADLIAEAEPVPTVTAELDAPVFPAGEGAPVAPVVPVTPAVQAEQVIPAAPVAQAAQVAPAEPVPPAEPPKPELIIPNDSVQAVKDIVNSKLELAALDFASETVRDIVLQCLKEKQSIALELDVNEESHREILKKWVDGNYANLLILNKTQRHADLVNIYLEHKFSEQWQLWHDANDEWYKIITLERSYLGQQIINYSYETRQGELVSYFDNYLGMPVKLKTQATFKIKVNNALSLVKGLDIELEKVDLGTLGKFIKAKINNCLRDTILTIIDTKKISYYDLPRFYSLIKDKIVSGMQTQFTKCGLAVTEAEIKDIAITNNAIETFETQYFKYAQLARQKEFENKLEAASLKLYEQKAAIHEKYPNFAAGLTEEEKDRALERYLKRVHQEKEPDTEKLETGILVGAEDPVGLPPKKPEGEKPEKPELKKNNAFRVLYGVLGGLWLAAGVVLLLLFKGQIVIGASVLGSGVLAMVLATIFGWHLLKFGVTKKAKKAYDEAEANYETALAEYNAKNEKYNRERAEYDKKLKEHENLLKNKK